jgi:hypothetical protein
VLFRWRPGGGHHVVVAGQSGATRIYNRSGEIVEDFNINEYYRLVFLSIFFIL